MQSIYTNRHTLRALALLLGFPDGTLRDFLPALVPAIDAEEALPVTRRHEIRAFAAELLRLEPRAGEQRYRLVFDGEGATSLRLLDHAQGGTANAVAAIADLVPACEPARLYLGRDDRPDHLCVLLELASTRPPEQARTLLDKAGPILLTICRALQERGSSYACLVAAALDLAGLNAPAVPAPAPSQAR